MYYIYKKLLDEKGISSYQVSKETGISQQTLSYWKSGRSIPKSDKMQKLADYLGVSINYLMGTSDDRIKIPEAKAHMVHAPLYSQISCGDGCFVDDEIIEYISLPDTILNPNKDYFAQYAKGDSMIYANINEGDLLIFEKVNTLDTAQIGCFCIDDSFATCKKFYRTDQGTIRLQPANDAYEPIIVEPENQCFRVLGKLAFTVNKR